MYGLLLGIHLLVCLCLVAVILVQSGKGGGLAGGAFGNATQTVFGGRGGTDFVTRATIVLGVIFFVTSISLALMTSKSGSGSKSIMQEKARQAASAPATPAPGAPAGDAPAAPAVPTTPMPAGGTTK
jgi:preprotein translocase subunit SecG